MCLYTYIYICMHLPTHTHAHTHSLFTEMCGSTDISTAMSITSIEILASKYYSSAKGTKIPWRNYWFQRWDRKHTKWAWNILSCQKVKKYSKNDHNMSERHRGPLASQTRDLYINNNDSHRFYPLNKIGTIAYNDINKWINWKFMAGHGGSHL